MTIRSSPPPAGAPKDAGAVDPSPSGVRSSLATASGVATKARPRNSHPLVTTIERKSAPRVLFSGDQLFDIALPQGSRVVYPRPPLEALKDVDAAVRYAINHPLASDPLHAKLRPGMRIVIAVDDISCVLPPMVRPDVRERVLTVVLEMLGDHGVEDVDIVIATSVHRRMTAAEVRHMVGDRIFDAYWPDRLYNHDAEDPRGMKVVGTTDYGELVELNRKAAEADLLIYVNVNFVPMSGGHKSVAVGLAGYRSLRAHHNPHVMRNCFSYMDPAASALATSVERMGRVAEQALDIFHIETTLNNRMFGAPLAFLAKNEDEWTGSERAAYRALAFTLSRVPQPARQAIFERVPSAYGVTGVFAGECDAVHARTLERAYAQYLVPVHGQADVLVFGVPFISPYNVHAFLNPLLVQVMAQGYLFNMYRGAPLVRKGGALILFHPCTDEFDREHHSPYVEFVHDVLPQTRDAVVMHKTFEERFVRNPAYIETFRKGHAYHPSHPFFMWYWGEAGRQHLGRTIVVGADNDYIPKLLGWERARSFPEALMMASNGKRDPDVAMLHVPPIVMADVTV